MSVQTDKKILLLETTSPSGSLGLYSFTSKDEGIKSLGDIKPLGVKHWQGDHSVHLNPAFAQLMELLDGGGLDLAKLLDKSPGCLKRFSSFKGLALGVGPGRWTGTRVGISFAKTLGFVLNVPLYPVSSLKILAESQWIESQGKPILVLLNAFKRSVYMGLYQRRGDRLKECIKPSVVRPEDLPSLIDTECVCVGDGYKAYESQLSLNFKQKIQVKNKVFPELKYLSQLLSREFSSAHFVSWRELKPVYLRSPVPALRDGPLGRANVVT